MKIVYTKLLFSLILVLVLSGTYNVFAQTRKNSAKKTKITVYQKTDDERRKEVELLLLDGKFQHDGSGELIYIGTIESIPALLKVLETYPPHIYLPCKNDLNIPPPPPLIIDSKIIAEPLIETVKKDCTPRKSYICTYSHALSALRKITGQNFVDFEDWKNWWKDYSKIKI